MRIETKDIEKIEIQDIECGELFRSNNDSQIFMRTDFWDRGDEHILCVNMEDGTTGFFDHKDKVAAIPSHLVIDE